VEASSANGREVVAAAGRGRAGGGRLAVEVVSPTFNSADNGLERVPAGVKATGTDLSCGKQPRRRLTRNIVPQQDTKGTRCVESGAMSSVAVCAPPAVTLRKRPLSRRFETRRLAVGIVPPTLDDAVAAGSAGVRPARRYIDEGHIGRIAGDIKSWRRLPRGIGPNTRSHRRLLTRRCATRRRSPR